MTKTATKLRKPRTPSAAPANRPEVEAGVDSGVAAFGADDDSIFAPVHQKLVIEDIAPSPFQPIERTADAALVAQIRSAGGLMHPITVRPLRGAGRKFQYELVAGQRRLDAYRQLDWGMIPAAVIECDDATAQRLIAIENLARENLPPLAEAQTIAALLEQPSQTLETIAAQLGHSPKWVAKRRSLLNLTADWQAHLRPVIHNGVERMTGERIDPWPLAHYFKIAATPPGVQSQLFDDLADAEQLDAQEIDHAIESRLSKLGSAPFDLADAELLPAAGPCNTCPKRAGANAYLWHDLLGETVIDQTANDQCLDRACYAAKLAAHAKATLAEAADNGSIPLVQLAYDTPASVRETAEQQVGKKRIVAAHDRQAAKKDDPAAVQTLSFDRYGNAKGSWTKPASVLTTDNRQPTTARIDANGDPIPKTAETKRLELHRRRLAFAATAFQAELDELEWDPKGRTNKLKPSELLAIAAVIGTIDNRQAADSSDSSLRGSEWETIRSLKTDAAANAMLWQGVRGVLVRRLDVNGPVTTTNTAERAWNEALEIAKLTGLRPQHFFDLATAELPEPKSWKK